jgi:hypothetical protein
VGRIEELLPVSFGKVVHFNIEPFVSIEGMVGFGILMSFNVFGGEG